MKGESVASSCTLTQEGEERESIVDENVPPLNLEDGERDRPDTTRTETSRSTLQRFGKMLLCI